MQTAGFCFQTAEADAPHLGGDERLLMQGAQRDVGDVTAGVDEIGRRSQRGRGHIGGPEANGIGDDSGQQARRDSGRQRDARFNQESVKDFGRRPGLVINDVERTEARVRHMVVEIGHAWLWLRQRFKSPAHA